MAREFILISHRKLPLKITRNDYPLATAFILISLSSLFLVILRIVFNEHISNLMTAGTIHGCSLILITIGTIFQGYWQQIEDYIKKHSEAEFTHSICPDCFKLLYPDYKFTE